MLSAIEDAIFQDCSQRVFNYCWSVFNSNRTDLHWEAHSFLSTATQVSHDAHLNFNSEVLRSTEFELQFRMHAWLTTTYRWARITIMSVLWVTGTYWRLLGPENYTWNPLLFKLLFQYLVNLSMYFSHINARTYILKLCLRWKNIRFLEPDL